MTSVLRTLQAEWNTLVPEAQRRGIRRVRMLNAPLETIEYRRTKLEWLKSQLGLMVGGFDQLTFGVEIECIMPPEYSGGHDRLARELNESGIPCRYEQYNHQLRTAWKAVTDGSLNNYRRGIEFVSPILKGEDGFRQLRAVCDFLTSKGCKVSKKCGLHVHVGAQAEGVETFRRLVKLYSSAEKLIDKLVSPSRRENNNHYCQPVVVNATLLNQARTVAQVASAVGQDQVRSSSRFCKLNLQSFWQHGTVEFRHHQGTVDATRAENWVRFCLRLFLTAKAGEKTVTSVEDLLSAVDASDSERTYFLGRVAYFDRAIERERQRNQPRYQTIEATANETIEGANDG